MYELQYDKINIPVYEYADAYSRLSELAERYKDDVTAVSRGGRNRRKLYYYNYPCSFDIETTTIRSGQLDYVHPEDRPVAFPYLFQFNIYGSVFMVRQYQEALDIFRWLGELFIRGEKKRLILYDHNLSYEWSFFAGLWDIQPKQCFAMDEHHPVTIVLTNGLMLRDSYKMTNMSLDTLSKDWSRIYKKAPELMDYTRLRTPYTELDKDTLLYSALDVLSLSEAITYFLRARGEPIWTKCPTSTSFIRAALKSRIGVGVKKRTKEQKKYFKMLERSRIDMDIYSYLLRQARGGNTHENRRFTGQLLEDVVHFDITSSYPAQMVCYPEFPCGEWMELHPDTSLDTIEMFEENGYCTLFDIVLLDPEIKDDVTVPYIPISKSQILKGSYKYTDNGRYLRGAEMLKLTIFGIELPVILKQYDISDAVILGGYFARKDYLPDLVRDFVLELYAQKTELKGVSGKEVEYSLAKTYVNGIYGMSFTKILRDSYEMDEADIIASEPKDPEHELKTYQNKTSYFLQYSTGCMVATLGRVYLQKMIDAVGEDFVYCDTDSVFALDPEKSRKAIRDLEAELTAYQRQCGKQLIYNDIKSRPHELGGIDEEPYCEKWLGYGAKKYATVEDGVLHTTIAGVPKKAGARIMGSIENFQLGMVFRGADTHKMCLWYNPDEGIVLHDEEGREIPVHANVAMLPVDYIFGLSTDYSLCLHIEGINQQYSFKEMDVNMNEVYI